MRTKRELCQSCALQNGGVGEETHAEVLVVVVRHDCEHLVLMPDSLDQVRDI